MLFNGDKNAAHTPEGGPAEAGGLSVSSLPWCIDRLARMPGSPLKSFCTMTRRSIIVGIIAFIAGIIVGIIVFTEQRYPVQSKGVKEVDNAARPREGGPVKYDMP